MRIPYLSKRSVHEQKAASVCITLGNRLLERLDYLKIQPAYILELGCGPGNFSKRLKKKYPKATVVSVDDFWERISGAKSQTFLSRGSWIQIEKSRLPFKTGTFDLIFAHQWLFELHQPLECLHEFNRIMKVHGCFMFSTLGPDTFKELSSLFNPPLTYRTPFIDMHDVGDGLMQAQFVDPVMDMEMLEVHYQNLPTLLYSLRLQKIKTMKQSPGLIGKRQWAVFEKRIHLLLNQDGKLPITYEVIYGHAWKGQVRQNSIGAETYIPISLLRKQ